MEGWVTRESIIERQDEVKKLFWWAFETKIKGTKKHRAFCAMGNTALDLYGWFWVRILRSSKKVSLRLSLSCYVVNNVEWSLGSVVYKGFEEKRGPFVTRCSIDAVEDIEENRVDERSLVDFQNLCEQASRWVDKRSWAIVKGRFIEERSLEDLGKELKITRERVRQIQDKGLQRIKNSIFGKNWKKMFTFPTNVRNVT